MPAKRNHVRIVSDGTVRGTRVEVDGTDISTALTSVSFRASVNDATRVTLEMFADVEMEGEARIVKKWRQARVSRLTPIRRHPGFPGVVLEGIEVPADGTTTATVEG